MILLLACADERPKTVVLVVLDTVRADTLAEAPHFQSVADAGLSFERAWAAAPWTLPSHGSLFTGLAPEAHRCASLRCDENTVMLAERFAAAGYATAGFSNNPWVSADTGLASGFGTFVEVFRSVYGPGHAVSRFVDPATTGIDDAGARRTVASVDRWLADVDGPAFVFVNLIEAHLPYDPPAPRRGGRRPAGTHALADRVRMDRYLADAWSGALTEADLTESRALYAEDVDYVDDRLGDLLAVLDRNDRGDALVIVTSDHGEAFGEHTIGALQLVDHQLSVYDELLHVPLAVRWPGRLAPQNVGADVSLMDVSPFLAWTLDGGDTPALIAAPPDRALTATYAPPADLAPMLADFAPAHSPLMDRAWRVVRRGSDKLIVRTDAPPQLFDLSVDPGELQDLAVDRVDTVRSLTPLLPAAAPTTGEATTSVEALRALGYVR